MMAIEIELPNKNEPEVHEAEAIGVEHHGGTIQIMLTDAGLARYVGYSSGRWVKYDLFEVEEAGVND